MGMHLGFDISDLYPHKAGVYTYGIQLLHHLARQDDPPRLVLLEGTGRRPLRDLPEATGGPLSGARYARARALPLLRSYDGPWQRRYRARMLSLTVDRRLLAPLWRQVYTSPRGARALLPYAATGPLDACHWSDNAFLRLPGVAHVLTVHDTIVLRHPRWYLPDDARYHTRKLYTIARHATRIIAVSDSTRRDAVTLLGIAPERIDVIPEAAGPSFHPPDSPGDAGARRAVLARYGLREGDYVLSVGTIEPRKNLVRLAAAFKRTIERSPELTTRLVLAGRRGWLTESIDRGLHELGLGDRLLMPGAIPREDLPALLHGARVQAYVSLYEGFGLPPLEAMACGTPVVASNTSSIPEVVGAAGLLVHPYKVEEIAAALHRVLTDDALRAELAARSLRRAARFSWARTAELTMETYRRAIATLRHQHTP